MIEEPVSPITQQTAFLCEALFTVFFVAPFYLSSTLRHSQLNSRNAPTVIRARTRAVGLVCAASSLITIYILAIYGHATPQEVLRVLGVWPVSLVDILKVLALVMILFTCSLYEAVIVDGEWRDWSPYALKEAVWDEWIGYRNLLIAPFSEEIVFRSLTIPLFLLARTTPTRIVFLTPLVFGGAHLHHLVEFLQSRTPEGRGFPPLSAWVNGVAMSLFQFTYTSIFGFFAAFVFLRTGNIWAAIAAHSFCNRMGLPRLWGRVGQIDEVDFIPTVMKGPDEDEDHSKRDDDANHVPGSPVKATNSLLQANGADAHDTVQDRPRSKGIAWSVVYYALVPIGIYGFYQLLWPLTESEKALATF